MINLENGFIKLYRSLIKWEWYSDVNTRLLFIHLILTCNYEDKKFMGHTIKRGQRLVNLQKLSKEVGISLRSTRTCIDKLKSTQELTHEKMLNCSLFTIVNYNKYQCNDTTNDTRPTCDRHATDTNERKIKKDKKDKEYIYTTNKNFIVPTVEEINAYCKERNNRIDAQYFFDYYQSKGWLVGKTKMKDWQASIRTWEKNNNENKTRAIKQLN